MEHVKKKIDPRYFSKLLFFLNNSGAWPLKLARIYRMELPKYKITTAQSTDPLYAGVLGTAKANWGGASMGAKLLELHPGLSNVLPNAKSSTQANDPVG